MRITFQGFRGGSIAVLTALAAPFIACGSDDDPPATTGGTGGTAGSSGASGSAGSAGSGGTIDGGGTSGSGGTTDSGSDAAVPAPEVTTDKGKVRGMVVNGVNAYLGIPYAATTGGANRWKPPQPAEAWTTTLETTKFGKLCPQITPGSTAYDPNSDENCLSVNVWSSNLTPSAPMPVMVWIHGGAFVFGSGGGSYDGAHLARSAGVVLVTLNYRLGILGYFSHPALSAEQNPPSSGAYGIQDQTAALQWVKNNIAKFGGDPANVTIFGESAGAHSVCFQLMTPAGRGLFHRAIVESGYCTLPFDARTTAEAQGTRYATAKGCTDAAQALSCLRAKPPTELIASASNTQPGGIFYQPRGGDNFSFQPVIDGVVLPDQPAAVLTAGNIAKVPVIQGSNTAEGLLFHSGVFGDIQPMTEAEMRAALGQRFGTHVDAIVAQYPIASYPSINEALSAVSSDAFFVCPARRTARLLTAAGVTNYLYSFEGPLDPALRPVLSGKSFHSADIPYVFGNTFVLGTIPDAYKPLATAVQGYWTRFAKTGDPNGGGAPAWPAYTAAQDQHLTLGMTIATGTGHNKAKCDFWDTVTFQ
jgi:para-nitrobenzyl esterase